VLLTCNADVNAQRMRSQERLDAVAVGKGMLLDTEMLGEIRSRGEVMRFECPELLELDISGMRPEEAAVRIVEHIVALEKVGKGLVS